MPNAHKNRRNGRRARPFSVAKKHKLTVQLHPLFWIVGALYACTGKLFLFLLSTLVAVQHECAHAFASAKLGYRLQKIVLMPFGAVIDGDMQNIRLKDEIFVTLCGPVCNLLTALFFVAIWWLVPTMYAFTDTACYVSLSVGLVNLLPFYPLDGGRILHCLLTKKHAETTADEGKAERRARTVCRITALAASLFLLTVFFVQAATRHPNFSLLFFALFLLCANLTKDRISYQRVPFSATEPLKRGTEIRRVAVLADCPVKDVFRFLSKGKYLVLEVYDRAENHLFDLSQNQLSDLFLRAESPYAPLSSLRSAPFTDPEPTRLPSPHTNQNQAVIPQNAIF